MEIRKLTGSLGAELGGLDLETIDDAGFAALHEALLAHQVVFLRGQELSEEGQRALAHRFGVPTVYPLQKHLGGREYLQHIEDTADNPPDADGWHMDITWIEHPPKVAILAAEVVPPHGGDTMWASLYAAWEQLSPTVQEMLAPLQVRHAPGEAFWVAVGRGLGAQVAELREVFPGAVHPLVRDHPETGRTVLNLGGYFMESIVGMHPDESAWLLAWRASTTRTSRSAGRGARATWPCGTSGASCTAPSPTTTRSTGGCAGARSIPELRSPRTVPMRGRERNPRPLHVVDVCACRARRVSAPHPSRR